MEKILVIEDDEIVRCNTTEILREEGFNVLEAENGRIGLDLARKVLPDLIISDILMPEMDGYGVLDELQKDVVTSSIPFIFLSARTNSSDIRLGMQKGADDYLAKPYKINDLLNAVNARLKKRRNIESRLDELSDQIAKYLPHELRTPLVAILGFSEFIRDYSPTLEPDEIIDMVGKINFAGNRLFKIIQKFLQHSEILTVSYDRTQLQNLRNSRILNAKNIITAYACRLADELNRREDLILNISDCDLSISEYYLQILLSELIENAAKFSNKGTPIRITASVENNRYLIEIADEGVGMNFQQIKNIGLLRQFNREVYNQSGIGIGLVLVKKITELHNGSFDIESISEEYTKATVSLSVFNKDEKLQ